MQLCAAAETTLGEIQTHGNRRLGHELVGLDAKGNLRGGFGSFIGVLFREKGKKIPGLNRSGKESGPDARRGRRRRCPAVGPTRQREKVAVPAVSGSNEREGEGGVRLG